MQKTFSFKISISKTIKSALQFFSGFALLLSLISPALADNQDIVMQAMQDEMTRSMDRLKLNGHSGPYFISYTVTEYDTLRLAASCGALTDNSRSRWRGLKVDVREGDYHIDSSHFAPRQAASYATALASNLGSPVTADNNYDALRYSLWLRTDAAYKAAIKNLQAKKNYLEQNNVAERPDDFSKETPTVSIEKPLKLTIDSNHWQSVIKSISNVFRNYPAIQRSVVTLTASDVTDWMVNSEGSRIRKSENQYLLLVLASIQADDGMQLADSRVFCANFESDLPKQDEIIRAVKEMNDNLIDLKSAHLATEYCGPLLLEDQSAAEFINQTLRHNLSHAEETLVGADNSLSGRRSQLKDLIGQSILPSFITIIDDPITEKFGGQSIVGGHKIDDDGVPGQKIVLVDKGILKTFCTSRTPTLFTKNSNGHSLNGIGEASILYINSDNQLNSKQLKEKLIEMGKKAGLKSVMIARRISTYDSGLFNPGSLIADARANGGSSGLFVRSPLLLYSVSVDDGHEELVRGAQFGPISMRVFRDIACTGNEPKPWFTLSLEPSGLAYYHLVTPSLLLGEVELHQPGKETDKLPIMSSPLSEK